MILFITMQTYLKGSHVSEQTTQAFKSLSGFPDSNLQGDSKINNLPLPIKALRLREDLSALTTSNFNLRTPFRMCPDNTIRSGDSPAKNLFNNSISALDNSIVYTSTQEPLPLSIQEKESCDNRQENQTNKKALSLLKAFRNTIKNFLSSTSTLPHLQQSQGSPS